jgi:hypothetical protein
MNDKTEKLITAITVTLFVMLAFYLFSKDTALVGPL